MFHTLETASHRTRFFQMLAKTLFAFTSGGRARGLCFIGLASLIIAMVDAGGAAANKPAQLRVAAAADLSFAMPELVREFQALHPEIAVSLTFGSSGNFYSQIANQAPFDLFFSADTTYPAKLAEEGMTLDTAPFTYAVGRLVLWVPKSSGLDLSGLGIESLRQEAVRHIAIANPKHAPYGRVAEAALRNYGIYDEVQPKLVYGENVAQTLQFVESGAAEAGFIAYALARAPGVRDTGRVWEVPADKYPRMEQAGVILKWTREPAAARKLRSFVLGPDGRRVLSSFGFRLPGE